MRTPQFVLSPLGVNRPAFSIPGVSQIRGVLIDNPSGAWLHLMPSDDYIPPYTLGFARTFAFPVVSCDLRFESPSGQTSTFAGDFPTLTLSDEPVPDSAGSSQGGAFIAQFTPVLARWLGTQIIPTNSNFLQDVIPAVANKRIRLLTMMLSYTTGFAEQSGQVQLVVTAASDGSEQRFNMTINGSHPIDFQSFPNGLDFPTGAPVTGLGLSMYSDAFVFIGATYQLI